MVNWYKIFDWSRGLEKEKFICFIQASGGFSAISEAERRFPLIKSGDFVAYICREPTAEERRESPVYKGK